MLRDLLELPTTPVRLRDDIGELKDLVRELLVTDGRVEQLERELHIVREATDEIKEVVPDLGRGPLAKAKDALSGE